MNCTQNPALHFPPPRLLISTNQPKIGTSYIKVPTIFWFVPPTASNLWWTAAVGVAVSAAISVRGAANLPAMALLWALYHSLVNVGQTWYSFGV